MNKPQLFNSVRIVPLMSLFGAVCLLGALPARSQEIMSTVAGNGLISYSGDGGPAINAALNYPKGLAIATNGTLYIADTGNFRVRSVNSSGIINTLAGNGVDSYTGDGGAAVSASFSDVMAVAVNLAGDVYIADASNRVVRMVSVAGTVTTIAGIGVQGFSGDGGLATAAALGRAVALALDPSGNLYIVDSVNQRVRRVATNGIITTIAGNGTSAYAGDGGLATLASFSFPLGVAVDGSGNVYIADAGNNRVRKITAAGAISTVAGNGQAGFSGDGGTATSAALNLPSDVALDSAGNLYIADAGNNRIRMVSSTGVITTIAGTSTNGFSGDGGPAAQAVLNYPWGLATDASGDVYVADRVNGRIRLISANLTAPPSVPANAVLNAASFATDVAVAPGAIVAIFGSNLAVGSMPATQSPLPIELDQTSVTFNGVAAPLFYVSPGQINAQVPFSIPSGSVSVQVSRGTSTSTAEMVNIASASPGIFIVNQANQTGAIVHLSGTVVTTSAPAVAGEYLSIYCTGLGPLNMAVQSGTAGPTTAPLPQTVTTPTVTIGGTAAVVAYSGLAPGFVGLYQVNVQVPAGLTAGNQQIQIVTGAAASNTATLAIQ
jgi:uncharacterized protein (TIGR03437 family)